MSRGVSDEAATGSPEQRHMTGVVVGFVVVALALAVLVGLIVWSRCIVERIHRLNVRTLREIRRGLSRDD